MVFYLISIVLILAFLALALALIRFIPIQNIEKRSYLKTYFKVLAPTVRSFANNLKSPLPRKFSKITKFKTMTAYTIIGLRQSQYSQAFKAWSILQGPKIIWALLWTPPSRWSEKVRGAKTTFSCQRLINCCPFCNSCSFRLWVITSTNIFRMTLAVKCLLITRLLNFNYESLFN